MGRFQNNNLTKSDRRPLDRGLTTHNALSIVLYQPRIPQNTGSIARMCAATGSRLELINPFFKIDDNKLKRAGLDYWHQLDVKIFNNLEDWFAAHKESTPWLLEVGSTNIYSEAQFQMGDFLMFGDEQEGIPNSLLQEYPQKHLSLPQINVRSLNLATSVGIVTFEALRQLQWKPLQK
jgi:tRNA (cytidine/uridine-2'-O-)-methyltransferase